MISNLTVLKKMLIIGILALFAFVAIGTIFLFNEKISITIVFGIFLILFAVFLIVLKDYLIKIFKLRV